MNFKFKKRSRDMVRKAVSTKKKTTTKRAQATTRRKKTSSRTTSTSRSRSAVSRKKTTSTRKYGKGSQNEVEKEMRKYKRGTAKSGKAGTPVKSRKQAIAIGLSKARKKGIKVPKKSS